MKVLLHLNASAAYIKIVSSNSAIDHADNALKILESSSEIPNSINYKSKAFFRIAQAYEVAKQYKIAIWNYRRSYKIEANSTTLSIIGKLEKQLAGV